jgi:kynurenine formamidase
MTMIIDLSHPLSPSAVVVCPGHPPFTREPVATLEKDPFNVHALAFGSHTGTHIDAPYHFFHHGQSVHELDLDILVAPAVVVDVRRKNPRERITWVDDIAPYANRLKPGVILLFCTGWSKYWGKPSYSDHPHLDPAAARKLVDLGIKVIGSDTLSPDEFPQIENEESCFDVHRVLLGAGCVIAENLTNLEALLDLGEVAIVSLLPLRLDECDGSPVRAVAWPAGSEFIRSDSVFSVANNVTVRVLAICYLKDGLVLLLDMPKAVSSIQISSNSMRS